MLGLLNDRDLVVFATDHIHNNAGSRDLEWLAEVAHLNQKRPDALKRASTLLREHVLAQDVEYSAERYASKELVRTLLKRRLQQYLDGNCTVHDVGALVAPMERYFDYPEWLVELYNAFDWSDKWRTSEDWAHVRLAVDTTLRSMD